MVPSPPSSFDQILELTQKPKLRKTFKLLKSHACKVANFTLQWQDLEDHLGFIRSEIESKLRQNPATKTIQNDANPPSKDSILPQNNIPENKTSKTSEISVKHGKELILYVKEHVQDHRLLQDYLFKLFKAVDEPGKLVLEALKEFYSLADTGIRWSCVVVLEEFGRVREEVDDVAEEVREEAKRLAVEWRGKLGMKNSLEVLGFLLLLIDFELVGEFGVDEILKLFNCVSSRKQAPELFRALGFADKAPDYIQELIAKNRRLEAVRFVYEFELVDQFPPVPLLKGHAKYAKKVAKEIRKKGKNSFEAQNNATESEIAALRGIIRFIENYQLGSEYSAKMLRNQIQQMKKQRKGSKAVTKITGSKADAKTTDSKADTKITGSNAQSLQNNGNRRTAPASMAEPTADLNAYAKASPPIYLKQTTHHQPTSSFEGQYTQNSTPLARTEAPSQAVPYTYSGAASNAPIQQYPCQAAHYLSHLSMAAQHLNSPPMYSKQTTHCQPTSSFVGQGTQNSTPLARTVAPSQAVLSTLASAASNAHMQQSPDQAALLLSHLSTVVQHLTSPFGNYNRPGSTPINSSYTSFSARPYELAGSATIRPHMGPSPIAPNGSSGQFGSGMSHAPIGSALGDLPRTSMYYNNWQASSPGTGIAPNTSFHASRYYDRPTPSGGNYGISSKFQPSIYHP